LDSDHPVKIHGLVSTARVLIELAAVNRGGSRAPWLPSAKLHGQPKEIKMNTYKGFITTTAIALAIAITAPSFAQTANMSVTVPFDFYVSDRLLPAGTYAVTSHARANAIQVNDGRGNLAFVIVTAPTTNRGADVGKVVFRQYEGASFLASVYWDGNRAGSELPTSRIERRLAENTTPPTRVALLLK
jgi:hypothetical protein